MHTMVDFGIECTLSIRECRSVMQTTSSTNFPVAVKQFGRELMQVCLLSPTLHSQLDTSSKWSFNLSTHLKTFDPGFGITFESLGVTANWSEHPTWN